MTEPIIQPLIAIVGPTATGKTDLALDLAAQIGAEIVNADAMQLYIGMDIGTAKLPPDQRGGIEHHQIDVLTVRQEASVAAYQRHARADIERIWARRKPAVLVGGSGLYIRAVLDAIEFPGTDPTVRAALEARAADAAPGQLHAELAALDPASAQVIAPGNLRRIVRALEVIEITGRQFSGVLPPYTYALPALQLGLDVANADLDGRIETRAEAMVAAGLMDEVAGLIDQGLRQGRTAARAIGYSHALAVLDGDLAVSQLPAAVALATRQLARRQRKWFRRDPRIEWFEAGAGDLTSQVMRVVGQSSAVRLG